MSQKYAVVDGAVDWSIEFAPYSIHRSEARAVEIANQHNNGSELVTCVAVAWPGGTDAAKLPDLRKVPGVRFVMRHGDVAIPPGGDHAIPVGFDNEAGVIWERNGHACEAPVA